MMFLSCTHPLASATLLIAGAMLVLNILLAVFLGRRWRIVSRWSVPALLGLSLLVFWLGSYPYSPLLTSGTGSQVLRGFLITTPRQLNQPYHAGDILVTQAGSPVAISAYSDLPAIKCQWASLHHGALDGAESCNIIYAAPQVENDILTVRVEPGCKLSPVQGRLKISILP